MIPVAQALGEITAQLKLAGIEEPRREARLLLAFALGTNAAGLLTRNDVDPALYTTFLARRAAREPLAYITGHQEFWGLDFLTSPATLIPRADTETLVEAALSLHPRPCTILDLGTGTGCLLLACLHELPEAFGVGVELNPNAAQLARHNARRLGLEHRAAFMVGNWCAALSGKFDLVLSNPPYIERADIASLMPEVSAYEPATALDGGISGLVAYQEIIRDLPAILTQTGQAVLEIGAGQAEAVADIAHENGFAVSFRHDLSGIKRAIILAFLK